jgi:hypothetical protein
VQLAPIREFIAAMTQREASQEQVTSDNVGAGVHAPVLAPLAAGVNTGKRMAITTVSADLNSFRSRDCAVDTPEIFQISPTSGPAGSRVEITGKNFQGASAVSLGTSSATLISPETLVTLIPHKSITSTITVGTPQGRASSPFAFMIANDPRVPDEVNYKAGYVNAVAPPRDFKSALLWGIAIVVTRVPGHESAEMEIASTQLIGRVDGKGVILNDNQGNVRGGL